MSHLQIPKGPRKRASTEAVIESEQHRKKATLEPKEEEKVDLRREVEVAEGLETNMDMSGVMAEIMEIKATKQRTEERAREDGRRIEKRTRLKVRRRCCECGEVVVIKSSGETSCCKHRCVFCVPF